MADEELLARDEVTAPAAPLRFPFSGTSAKDTHAPPADLPPGEFFMPLLFGRQ